MKYDYNFDLQHKRGKLHAIERIRLLLDHGTFVEIGSNISHYETPLLYKNTETPYDGVITGFGEIFGKNVFVYSQDFTIMGGSLGNRHGKKIADLIRMAEKARCPVIGINDSGGARIQEGVHSLAGYGDIFFQNVSASGVVPQIAIIAGHCAGGAVYSPALMDFVFVIDKISHMYVTGPKVVKSVTGKSFTSDELGGAELHSNKSGVAHFFSDTEEQCFESVRRLIGYLPCSSYSDSKDEYRYAEKNQFGIENILPDKKNKTYDMHKIIEYIFDKDSFIEIQKDFAKNILIGFCKLSNILVGVIANQPYYMAGVIDSGASVKASRFIRFCDAFDIPIVTITDVPGFMPGLEQEESGIIRHGAKLLFAYSEATVAKINLIVRKAYGGAYIAMCSKHLNADFVYAWPSAEIAVMGADGAVDVLFGKNTEIQTNDTMKNEKINEYEKTYLNPNEAAKSGYIDEIIDPVNTRLTIFNSLKVLSKKRESKFKHRSIPL